MSDVVEKLEDYDPDRAASTPLAGAAAEEHIRRASASGIFGDTDTTAGASASGTDVPSANNEEATVEVAKKDAAIEGDATGVDGDAEGTSDAQARRQVDVEAGTTASAEDVDAAADDDDAADEADADDDDDEENLSPQQKAARTRAANKAKEEDS